LTVVIKRICYVMLSYLRNYTSDFQQFCTCYQWRSSVLLWQRCYAFPVLWMTSTRVSAPGPRWGLLCPLPPNPGYATEHEEKRWGNGWTGPSLEEDGRPCSRVSMMTACKRRVIRFNSASVCHYKRSMSNSIIRLLYSP